MKSRNLSVYIKQSPSVVYDFVSNPANLPLWVPSFCESVEFTDGHWVVQSPQGLVIFTFVEANPYGILDHTVTFPSGTKLTNPMRVIPNDSGSELIFTLFQHAGMTDEQFVADASLVKSDLETLRGILESI